jgi:hypothetical protein
LQQQLVTQLTNLENAAGLEYFFSSDSGDLKKLLTHLKVMTHSKKSRVGCTTIRQKSTRSS